MSRIEAVRPYSRLACHALVALLLLVGTACSQDRALAVDRLNKGLQANNRGETAEAVELLKEATEKDPSFAKPAYILGQIYQMKFQELDNAETYYRMAISRDPEKAKYHYKLGTVLAAKGNHQDAIGSHNKAVELDPDHAKALFRRGQSQLALKKYRDAVGSYMQSIEADARMRMDDDSKGGEAYHALGDLYVRFGFFDKALKVYNNGVRNNPQARRLYQGRGVAQLELERYSDALELDPNYTTALFNLAVARKEMGKSRAAHQSLKDYISRADPAKEEARISAAHGLISEIEIQLEREKKEK
jgi:tetratricopeptide (TPR) repeat protein